MKQRGGLQPAAAAIMICLAAWNVAGAQGTGTVVRTTRQIPAYSTQPPHGQRGYFPQNAALEVLGDAGSGFLRVRFHSLDGRILEGLCRSADVARGTPPPAAPDRAERTPQEPQEPAAGTYKERDWLEGVEGHKEALAMQSKHKAPLLIHFYTDWNEECQVLRKELLDETEFKNKSKHIIKLRINPEHGKEEGKLAAKYRLRRYPTTLVFDKPHTKARVIDLSYWSFGRLRVLNPDKAVLTVMIDLEAEKARLAEEKAKAAAATNAPVPAGKPQDDGLIEFDEE